jgi:hypothetical protein
MYLFLGYQCFYSFICLIKAHCFLNHRFSHLLIINLFSRFHIFSLSQFFISITYFVSVTRGAVVRSSPAFPEIKKALRYEFDCQGCIDYWGI